MHHSRTPPYDKAICVVGNSSANDGHNRAVWLRPWLLWRIAVTLAGVLLLCGFAAGITLLFQQRLITASGSGAGSGGEFQVVAIQMAPSAAASGGGAGGERLQHRQRDLGGGDEREYLASNLSLLLNGGWSSEARFHPATFPLETEILNRTVYCDRPSKRDISLVYSEPTWLCKNVRVAACKATGSGGQQGLVQRLPFSDTTSRTLEMMLNRQKELLGNSWSTSSDACGQLPDRRDNVLLLCELLLARLRMGEPMWAGRSAGNAGRAAAAAPLASSVHIPFGNCSLPDEKRILLVGMATGDAVWYTENNWKSGFVTDLYCSFLT